MIEGKLSNKSGEDILFEREMYRHFELIILLVSAVILVETLIKYSYLWTVYL